jgi:hypothetical protein
MLSSFNVSIAMQMPVLPATLLLLLLHLLCLMTLVVLLHCAAVVC